MDHITFHNVINKKQMIRYYRNHLMVDNFMLFFYLGC